MHERISDELTWRQYAKGLGIRLRRLRDQRGLSQERVASDAGLSTVQYQRLESGGFAGPTPNPTSKTLIAIAQILDVTIDELLPPTMARPTHQMMCHEASPCARIGIV